MSNIELYYTDTEILDQANNLIKKIDKAYLEIISRGNKERAKRMMPYLEGRLNAIKKYSNLGSQFKKIKDYKRKLDIYIKSNDNNVIYEDKDYKRNKAFIEKNNITYEQIIVTISGISFKINIYKKEGEGKQNFLILHDSENSAFDVGLLSIANGGKLISLENGENRNLQGTNIDPNSIFYNNDGKNKYSKLKNKILNLIGKGTIITLHNNTNKGGLDISNIKNTYPNVLIFNAGDDKDNMIWLSSNIIYNQNYELQQEIKKYTNLGLNVVYEYVPKGGNDNSLSNWAASNNRKYYNIEIQKYETKIQYKYLSSVLLVINS